MPSRYRGRVTWRERRPGSITSPTRLKILCTRTPRHTTKHHTTPHHTTTQSGGMQLGGSKVDLPDEPTVTGSFGPGPAISRRPPAHAHRLSSRKRAFPTHRPPPTPALSITYHPPPSSSTEHSASCTQHRARTIRIHRSPSTRHPLPYTRPRRASHHPRFFSQRFSDWQRRRQQAAERGGESAGAVPRFPERRGCTEDHF